MTYAEPVQVKIFNGQGRLITRVNFEEEEFTIDLSDYPPSVYNAVFETQNSTETYRLIIVK
jgi:hypothetical protein